MSAARAATQLDQLRRLAATPDEQAALAARLLTERNAEVQLAALRVLTERPDPAWRPALLRAYAPLQAGGSRRDPGGALRAAVVRALAPVALLEDAPLLEQAATTYEFLYGEAAGDLRAAAIQALDQVDHRLAGFHAVRLLTDQHTSTMSGEPAVTAARLLAGRGEALPLYAYVVGGQAPHGEVAAECLRGLTTLPASLLPGLVTRYRESTDEILLLGLFDLLLAHEARAAYRDVIVDFLRETRLLALYRSLVVTLVTTREAVWVAVVEGLAGEETDPRKQAHLREALALATPPTGSRRRSSRRESA